ncbi:hypothetical protein [Streptomyces sporangiiformans]|uniref:hypothetical protein n=1 Tax=Streptomyces sporangiiformans TaxID=2315329 RepID=UPI001968EB80|nr:hypothetical protein [Streptomyces sporangiiformans]
MLSPASPSLPNCLCSPRITSTPSVITSTRSSVTVTTRLTTGDWCRIALYRLTDALEHLQLLIGTIAAHMRHNQLAAKRICAYLQVPTQERADAFITPAARRHPAGLLGEPSVHTGSDPLDIDHRIGQGIVQRNGFVCSEREATLEAFLASLYSSYAYEPSALDERPEPIRSCAMKAADISLVPVETPQAE